MSTNFDTKKRYNVTLVTVPKSVDIAPGLLELACLKMY